MLFLYRKKRGFTPLEINRKRNILSLTGFTIVELMIVTSIIAVLISIALPTYGKIRKDTKARICRANLRQVHIAIEQWSFQNDIEEGTSLSGYKDAIYSYLKTGEPSCPSGGIYILTNLGDNRQVTCSSGLEGHEYP